MFAYLDDIHDLLQRQGRCLLPHIGLLALERWPARLEGQRLLPPGSRAVLRPARPEDEACSLVKVIAERQHLDAAAAAARWEGLAGDILQKLAVGASIPIAGVGWLNINEDGSPRLDTGNEFPTLYAPLAAQLSEPETPPSGGEAAVAPAPDPVPELFLPRRGAAWWAKYGAATWVSVIVLALGVVIWFTYRGLGARQRRQAAMEEMVEKSKEPNQTIDSLQQAIDSSASQGPDTIAYTIVIGVYHDQVKAARQYNKMKHWGHPVVLLEKASGVFELGIPFRSLPADTTENLEKMRQTYGRQVFLDPSAP